MEKKKGKKSGGQKEQQGAGGHPEEESAQREQQARPSQPKEQQKRPMEPALRSGGGDIAAGPSQQPQGQRRRQQPWSQSQAQQPQQQPPHVAGMVGGQQTGQAEYRPGVPPPRMKGPWGQPVHSVGPDRHAFRRGGPKGRPQSQELSFRASGGRGQRGVTPPRSQAQSSPPAPSEYRPGVPPPRMEGPWGQPVHSVGPDRHAFRRGGPKGRPQSQELSFRASGGRGQRGVTPPQSQAQSSPPAPSGTVKKTAESADVVAITKGATALQITKGALQIPRSKGCGTQGRRTVVETNYLSLNLSNLRSRIAYHYDVEFQPPLPKRLLSYAMEAFRVKHFPDRHPAFDGRRNLYASQELPEISDVVQVCDEESNRVKEFKVTVKYATQIDMESLTLYMERGSSVVPPQNAIQAVDVVLRSARMSRGFVQVGRSFFTPPSGQVVSLGDGLEMWYGVFQSAVLGWKPFLNIDVAHKGFPKPQRVVDAIYEICNPRDGNELNCYQKEDFLQFIRGLKVDYMLPNNPSSKRTYRVNGIAESSAKLWFKMEDNQPITVQDYFSHFKRVRLQFPHFPCLHVGPLNREKPIYLPPELCMVSRSQVINKKMNEKQTTAMIRSAATSTDVRKNKIMDALRAVRFNEDPCVQEFGISVGGKFEEVEARILDAPRLEYKNQKFASPDSGVWRPQNFVDSRRLGAWIILNLDGYVREDALRNFVERMQEMGRTLGMKIEEPNPSCHLRRPQRAELQSFFSSMKSKVDLVVVVIPDKQSYVNVKQDAELTVGVLTQCIKSATIRNLKPATCSNILLKVNSKLNGMNHKLASVSKPPCLQTPAMIVGADVTHPPPDQMDKPSVAAVCASHDPQAFKYNIQIRLQPPRAEIIQDMEDIMKQHLLYFYHDTNQKPERIIFYRDGVSEGQFREVLQSEVNAIRRACTALGSDYEPMVTFLVVQKRHHTRFFPTKREDMSGKNRNVPPGTVVDRKITHPTELDFFLVSHASIQGVSRPTKYHLLWNDDDNMTTDVLEQLTYYLCHMFSRCTRSVSYPAPTYYAHLAAYRAGIYLLGPHTVNLANLEQEQRNYFERAVLKDIMKDSPMYFV